MLTYAQVASQHTIRIDMCLDTCMGRFAGLLKPSACAPATAAPAAALAPAAAHVALVIVWEMASIQ